MHQSYSCSKFTHYMQLMIRVVLNRGQLSDYMAKLRGCSPNYTRSEFSGAWYETNPPRHLITNVSQHNSYIICNWFTLYFVSVSVSAQVTSDFAAL